MVYQMHDVINKTDNIMRSQIPLTLPDLILRGPIIVFADRLAAGGLEVCGDVEGMVCTAAE